MRLVLVGRGVEELLREPQLAVAADERRLEPCDFSPPARPAVTRRARQSCIGLRLALQLVETRVGVRDRRLRRPPCRIADEHRVRIGCTLHAGGRVDEVARDHALPCGAEIDRRLAGEHRGAGTELRHPGLAPNALTAATSSSAARTARSASSSCATGVPQTAITASPMNFSTTPPYRPMTARCDLEVPRQKVAHLLGVARPPTAA